MKEHALSLLTPGLVALACHPTLLGGRVGWRGMFRFALMEPGGALSTSASKEANWKRCPLVNSLFYFYYF